MTIDKASYAGSALKRAVDSIVKDAFSVGDPVHLKDVQTVIGRVTAVNGKEVTVQLPVGPGFGGGTFTGVDMGGEVQIGRNRSVVKG